MEGTAHDHLGRTLETLRSGLQRQHGSVVNAGAPEQTPDSAPSCCLTFKKLLKVFLCLSFPNSKMGEIRECSDV